MTKAKAKARTNNFNGERAAKAKSPERIRLVEYLLENPGPYTYDQLREITGYSRHIIESRLRNASEDNEVLNLAPMGKAAQWQHRTHYKPVRAADVVSRRDPICNAGMPNGSRSFWAAQMASFNTPPRAA